MRFLLMMTALLAGGFLLLTMGQLKQTRDPMAPLHWVIVQDFNWSPPYDQSIDLMAPDGGQRQNVVRMSRARLSGQRALAVSPDGEWLFFGREDDRRQALHLWRVKLARAASLVPQQVSAGRLLLTQGHQIESPPLRFSPDGQSVAFFQLRLAGRRNAYEVVVLAINSGATQVVFSDEQPINALTWSPDGAMIYVVAGQTSYRIDLSTLSSERLADFPVLPVWSGDGRVLWQGTGFGGRPRGPVYVREEGVFRALTPLGGRAYYEIEAWAPGDWLLLTAESSGSPDWLSLWQMRVDGSQPARFFDDIPAAHRQIILYTADDGSWALVYVQDELALYRLDMPGQEWARLVEDISFDNAQQLAVTRDGWLLLVVQRGEDRHLLRMRPDGSRRSLLAELPLGRVGSQFAMYAAPGGEGVVLDFPAPTGQLWWVTAQTGETHELPEGSFGGFAAVEVLPVNQAGLLLGGLVLAGVALALVGVRYGYAIERR